MKAQRLRFRYRVTSAAGSLGNRELVAAWEAAIKRAGYLLAYSEGRRTSPLIALAAPLPLGVTSGCELADVFLEQPASPDEVLRALPTHLPEGIEPLGVSEQGVNGPSLQSEILWAEYECVLPPGASIAPDLRRRVSELLAAPTFPSEYVRSTRVKSYDLRPLILALDISEGPEALMIRMRLRAEQDRTARADQVLLALGIEAEARIHRTRLEVAEVSSALQAYRRAGEPTGSELQ